MIYINTTELGERRYEVERATNKFIDTAKIIMKPTDSVSIGDEIKIYKNSNLIFGGYAHYVNQKPIKTITAYGYGIELDLKGISKVWYNTSPESIVQELVGNTNLTYASTVTSGVTLDKYVAQDKRYSEVISDLAKLLDWQIWSDPDKNFYFEPRGYNKADYTLNMSKREWNKDTSKLMNKISLIGGKATFTKEDDFTGDGSTTVFYLTYKPVGNVRVLNAGTELTPDTGQGGDYTVDDENKKITFTTAPASGNDINIYYSYEIPVRIEMKNPSSISKYGEFFKKVEAKWIKTFDDGRAYARKLLSFYSEPLYTGKITIAPNYNIKPGDKVTINDTVNNINDDFVIQRVKIYSKGRMEVVVGEELYDQYEWKQEVEDRIKQLEQTLSSTNFVFNYLTFQEKVNTNVKVSRLTVKYRTVMGNLIWDHPTYGIWNDGQWGKIYKLICNHPEYGKVEYQNEFEANVLEKGYSEWTTHYEVTG